MTTPVPTNLSKPSTQRHSTAVFFVAVMGIFLLNSGINAVFYDTGLPLLYIDEGYLYQEVSVQRGVSSEALRFPGYPPLMLGIYHIAQNLSGVINPHDMAAMERATHLLRLMTALSQVITLALLMALARLIGGKRAAVPAGIAFVLLPGVHQWMLFAQPEAWAMPWILTSAGLAWWSLRHQQRTAALGATFAALIAIGFKYSFVPVLGLGMAAVLVQLLSGRRKQWVTVLVAQIVMIVLWAVALFTVFDAAQLLTGGHAESSQFTRSGIRNLFNPTLLEPVIAATFRHIAVTPVIWLGVIDLATVWIMRQWRTPAKSAWLMLAGITLANVWFIVAYLVFADVLARYTSVNSGLLILLLAVAVVTIARQLRRTQSLVIVIATVAWLAVPGIELAQKTAQEVRGAQGIDHYFRDWLVSRSGGGVALEDETLWLSFHPVWGANNVPRTWVPLRELPTDSLQHWLDKDIRYIAITENSFPQAFGEWLKTDQLLLLKSFPNAHETADLVQVTSTFDPGALHRDIHQFSIYQLFKPHAAPEVVYDNTIRLVGYDLNTTTLRRGDTLTFTPYWQALATPAADYQLFVHLTGTTPEPLAQADTLPATERFPTTQWLDPQEIIVGSTLSLVIPENLAAGRYDLRIGLYRLDTLERLRVSPNADTFDIALTVVTP